MSQLSGFRVECGSYGVLMGCYGFQGFRDQGLSLCVSFLFVALLDFLWF